MATVLLVRHARSTANAGQVLAGRTPGVDLDEVGLAQAVGLAERLRPLRLVAAVSSPLERCLETIRPTLVDRDGVTLEIDDRLTECDYGEWTGQPLKALARTPLWKVVQAQPAGVVFPGGESMLAMQHRAVTAVRERDRAVEVTEGPDAVWLAVSHADVIKSVVADALGLHLDEFQRIVVDPGSVTVVRYTPLRPFVVRVNDHGPLDAMVPPPRKRSRRSAADRSAAVVGGTTG